MQIEPKIAWGIAHVNEEYSILLCKIDYNLLGYKVSDKILDLSDEGSHYLVKALDNNYYLDKSLFDQSKIRYIYQGLISKDKESNYHLPKTIKFI